MMTETGKTTDKTKTLLNRITERPLMVAPLGVDSLTEDLEALTSHADYEGWMSPQARHTEQQQSDAEFFGPDEYGRPYAVVDGVLQIPVMGMLLNRFSRQFGTFVTGYQYIERALSRGLADPQVRGIALVIDSNGGEAAGAFELTDKIYEARGTKPIRAFVSDKALSAAYALASAADNVIVTRAGSTGSIGVMAMHISLEKALEQRGLEVTFIFKGEHKIDGNRFQALPDAVKAQFQKRIDKAYAQFTETVARNRNMGQDAVEDTEALVYDSDESLETGLADRIGALDDEMIAFTEELDPTNAREDDMNAKTEAAPTIPEGYVSPDAHAEAVAKAGTDAVTTERARVSAVQADTAYKGRETLASHLLNTTSMSADEISKALEVSPIAESPKTDVDTEAGDGKDKGKGKDSAKGGADQFSAHMDKDGHPGVGADAAAGDGDDEGNGEPVPSTALLAAYQKAGGRVIDRTAGAN